MISSLHPAKEHILPFIYFIDHSWNIVDMLRKLALRVFLTLSDIFLICGIGIKKFPDIPNISLSWLQINILFSRWATPEKCNNALLPDTNVNKKHTLMRLKTLTSDATQSLDSRIFLPFIHYYSTTEDWPEAITFLRIDTPTERHTSNSPRRQDGPSRRHYGTYRRHYGRLKDGRKLRWSKAILVRGYAGRSLWMKQQGLEGCRMACLVEKK